MELDELSPPGIIAALVAGGIGYFMVAGLDVLGMVWRVLTPVVCAIGGYLIMAKMADN